MKEPSPELVYLLLSKKWNATLNYMADEPVKAKPKLHAAKMDSEAAYAVIKYWPDHIVKERHAEGSIKWEVQLVDRSVKNRPFIEFWTADTLEQATAKAAEMESFFKAHMDAAEVAGLSPFRRAAAIYAQFKPVLDAPEKAELAEAARVQAAAERKAKRSVAQDPASKLFDAALLIKNGSGFTTTAQVGSYHDVTKSMDSSMKAALKILGDPKRPLIEAMRLTWMPSSGMLPTKRRKSWERHRV